MPSVYPVYFEISLHFTEGAVTTEKGRLFHTL